MSDKERARNDTIGNTAGSADSHFPESLRLFPTKPQARGQRGTPARRGRSEQTLGQVNYWGYSPVSFFAPHQGYSSRQDPLGPVDEFRDMVKALHRADIEVILDVAFNHTAEGDHRGPTLSFRGLDNSTYYNLEADRSRYANYSRTGNSLNANHPVVRRMILDSLHYRVDEMHVDGFRFDLVSVPERDEWGNLMPNPPVLWDIDSDPCLAGVKRIAEAWNAAGLCQVGSFIGDSWKEWTFPRGCPQLSSRRRRFGGAFC